VRDGGHHPDDATHLHLGVERARCGELRRGELRQLGHQHRSRATGTSGSLSFVVQSNTNMAVSRGARHQRGGRADVTPARASTARPHHGRPHQHGRPMTASRQLHDRSGRAPVGQRGDLRGQLHRLRRPARPGACWPTTSTPRGGTMTASASDRPSYGSLAELRRLVQLHRGQQLPGVDHFAYQASTHLPPAAR